MRLPLASPQRILPLLAAFVMAQSIYNTTLPLSGDEAYYWVWSHHLQAGYHDHPPMIALLIAATTRLWGDSVMAVRLAAALCMALTVFLQVRLAARIGGDKAGWLAFALCLLLPAFEMGFTLATPDDPLVLFWSAGLLFALSALTGEERWRDYVGMGVCCGLAMASKYTGVLLPLSLTLYVALRRPRDLLSPRLWAAGAAALLVFSPVLWWNAAHGFESFLFQYRHGSGEARPFDVDHVLQFLGGQLLVLSPILALLLVGLAARWRVWWRDRGQSLLMLCFLAPMALFLEKALFAKIQLNWALPAYLSALPLLAAFLVERRRRWLWIAACLLPALALTVALKWPLAVGLTGKHNPHNRLYGPETAAREIERLRRPDDAIMADHLQRAALLSFLLSGHPRAYIPTESRYSEYTRWDRGVDMAALHGLYLSQDDRAVELGRIFAKVELVERMHSFRAGGREQSYYIFRVGN
jgi:4-amino-4-deoxy-L-arabinose transferase-like glycosyltransferase